MRTTLSIDDDLLEQVRAEATASGLTLGEAVNRALRRGLRDANLPVGPFQTLTFGDPDAAPPDPRAMRALADDELDWLRRKCDV